MKTRFENIKFSVSRGEFRKAGLLKLLTIGFFLVGITPGYTRVPDRNSTETTGTTGTGAEPKDLINYLPSNLDFIDIGDPSFQKYVTGSNINIPVQSVRSSAVYTVYTVPYIPEIQVAELNESLSVFEYGSSITQPKGVGLDTGTHEDGFGACDLARRSGGESGPACQEDAAEAPTTHTIVVTNFSKDTTYNHITLRIGLRDFSIDVADWDSILPSSSVAVTFTLRGRDISQSNIFEPYKCDNPKSYDCVTSMINQPPRAQPPEQQLQCNRTPDHHRHAIRCPRGFNRFVNWADPEEGARINGRPITRPPNPNQTLEEAGLLNYFITTDYSKMAALIRKVIECHNPPRPGGLNTAQEWNANWFHYGVWASRKVGTIIRSEDPLIKAITLNGLVTPMRAAIRQTQLELAKGNWFVYEDIMPIARVFVNEFGRSCSNQQRPPRGAHEGVDAWRTVESAITPQRTRLERALNTVGIHGRWEANESWAYYRAILLALELNGARPGKYYAKSVHGQDALYWGFWHWYQATMADTEAGRMQHMHIGNFLLGVHEQMLLQSYIKRAFDPIRTNFPNWNPRQLIPNLNLGELDFSKFSGYLISVMFPRNGQTGGNHVGETSGTAGFTVPARVAVLPVYENVWARSPYIIPRQINDHTLKNLPGSMGRFGRYVLRNNLQQGAANSDWTNYEGRMLHIAGTFAAFFRDDYMENTPFTNHTDQVRFNNEPIDWNTLSASSVNLEPGCFQCSRWERQQPQQQNMNPIPDI